MTFNSCKSRKKGIPLFIEKNAVVAQLVEHGLPKPRVAGSNPVYRSKVGRNILPTLCLLLDTQGLNECVWIPRSFFCDIGYN